MKTVIRCYCGGQMLGTRFEDEFGNPLNKRTARRIAEEENRHYARRKENGNRGPFFTFAVYTFEEQPA